LGKGLLHHNKGNKDTRRKKKRYLRFDLRQERKRRFRYKKNRRLGRESYLRRKAKRESQILHPVRVLSKRQLGEKKIPNGSPA